MLRRSAFLLMLLGVSSCWAATFEPVASTIYETNPTSVPTYSDEKPRSDYRVITISPESPSQSGGPLGDPSDEVRRTIAEACARHHISFALALAVARVESNYSNLAKSSKGAIGLMQVLPVNDNEKVLLWDMKTNVDAGVSKLEILLKQFKGSEPLALAAYNAGARPVQSAGTRIPGWPETSIYVARVLDEKTRIEHRLGASK